MKKLCISIVLACISLGSYANIMEKVFVDQNDMLDVKDVITAMYDEEVSKKNSIIKSQVLALMTYATEDEVTFITNNNYDLPEEDFFDEKVYLGEPVLVSSGRSGAAYHGASYIVPIIAASPGTGMIQETIAFLKVSTSTSFYNMETDTEELTEVFTFTKLATLKDL